MAMKATPAMGRSTRGPSPSSVKVWFVRTGATVAWGAASEIPLLFRAARMANFMRTLD
jgi:hypothetical protein